MRRGLIAASLLALTVLGSGCGGHADPVAANRDLVERLVELPDARPVAVEHYGYDLGDGRAEERFFTEVEYETSARPGEVVDAVEDRLGEGWDVAAEGGGDTVVASFRKDDARVEVTTWDGGFDVTVAARGAELDGTSLSL